MIITLVCRGLYIGAFAALVMVGCPVEAQPVQTGFAITSTTFTDGGMLPRKVAFPNSPQTPNCVGENVSPQLSWTKIPLGTKSFALTMVDQEGGGGIGDIDLVAYGIPVNVTSFAEGELSKPSNKFVGGTNVWKLTTFRGMCPPPGTSPHHYVFKVIATDLDPQALRPGLTLAELESGFKGHVKGAAAIVGLFAKP